MIWGASSTQGGPVVAHWRVRLLGDIGLHNGQERIDRLPSRAVALLLARLALWPQRLHTREALIDALWPGVSIDVGRNRLRQVLSTLKSLLEPPGRPAVLVADRSGVRVAAGAIDCDVLHFEAAVAAGRYGDALGLYRGELLPGFYEDWVDEERLRLAALADTAGAAARSTPLIASASVRPAAPATGHAPHLLPAYLTRYFGADAQFARLRGQLQAHRLVTLIGPGGSGKTRLAVELARSLRDTPDIGRDADLHARFDLVAFVPLVNCTDDVQMLEALRAALMLPTQGPGHLDAIAAHLAERPALLVLDNFEQLVDHAAIIVADLVARVPTLHLIVTSRRALGVDGEREFALAPLSVPAAQASPSDVAENPAAALFVDRARAVRADYHLGERNAAVIGALVRALEGMPLAIELAAARVRSIAPADMIEILQGRVPPGGVQALDLLSRTGPRGGLDPRHASMRRVVAWSWELLTPAQQTLLQALTVFSDAFTAAAALHIAGHEVTAVDLDELVANSLVRAQPGRDGLLRFVVYEPVRQFSQAFVSPEATRRHRERLRDWLIGWAAAQGRGTAAWQFERELPHVQAMLRTAPADGADVQALQLAVAMRSFWDVDGMSSAQVDVLAAILRAVDAHPDAAQPALRALRCDGHELLAYLRVESGSAAAAADDARQAIECAGDDPRRRGRALVRQAWVWLVSGRADVSTTTAWLHEALSLVQACGDAETQARALHQLAVVAKTLRHDAAGAEALLERSQALWEALGDRGKALARLRNRAQCWQAMGRLHDALDSFRQCEAAVGELGDWVGMIDATLSQGTVLADLRRWDDAAQANARCVALCWQRHHAHGMGYALWNQARVFCRLRRPAEGGRLMAFAERFWRQHFGPVSHQDELHLRRVRRLVERQIGVPAADAAWAAGTAMTLSQAVDIARSAPPPR